MSIADVKANGAYYTPTNVASTLVHWAVRKPTDRLLDPACGDGEFICLHPNSVGVEHEQRAAITASRRARGSLVHIEDFFSYAQKTTQRFECAAGNPPFIRYQRFSGEVRRRALRYCKQLGVRFTALTSSWAPFLVGASSLLKPGGRIAFVVPAEIGHSTYAAPLVEFLARSFESVQLIAIRDTVFTQLSQDVWLLYAQGRGRSTDHVKLTTWDTFRNVAKPPANYVKVSVSDWRQWNSRLRPFILPQSLRRLYERLTVSDDTYRLGDVARVGIGYVSGANDFFHLRPSQAEDLAIPGEFLIPTVRSSRVLRLSTVDRIAVKQWIRQDEACLLLHIRGDQYLPTPVRRYLDTESGRKASMSYKCANRSPWYSVPDVQIPDGFLAYMSGDSPFIVANNTRCTGTNSVHIVRMKGDNEFSKLQRHWGHALTQLSVEVEGHALGGGMLKLEPREATRVLIPHNNIKLRTSELQQLEEGRQILRQWRHYE